MNEESKSAPNAISPESPNVVFGHKTCQTSEARWLCIEHVYQKLHRPNFYDIGGTYIIDVKDYWFAYKTEQMADLYLLHLYLWNQHKTSFTISVSGSNECDYDKKNDAAFLLRSMEEYNCEKKNYQQYIKTFVFRQVDIDQLKDKRLYIAILFSYKKKEVISQEIIENVKYNHDFGALLKDPVVSDVIIEVADGYQFKAHKVLLSAYSDVFKAMLTTEMAEGQSGYVKLVDVTKEDFQNVLECIYTGTISDLNNCNPISLLELANRFNLQILFDICEYVLSQNLTLQNVVEYLILADMYNAHNLKTDAMRIIKKNKFIIKSRAFKQIKNIDLTRELVEYMVPSE